MALNLPGTATEISQKSKLDVSRELPVSNPFLARSYIGSIISSLGNRVYEFYLALRDSELESIPSTAIRNLVRWANVWGVVRLPGGSAAGTFFLDARSTGTGILVPINTRMIAGEGDIYIVQAGVTLGSGSLSNTSLTQVAGVATFVATAAHMLGSNAVVTITGATPTGYNLSEVAITVISETTFTYEVDSTIAGTAAGTPVAGYIGGTITISAEETGSDQELVADTPVSFETPIASVETSGNVTFGGVIDGQNVESDDELRDRFLDRIRNPVTAFNSASITAQARLISGVTRVFIQEKTPALGQVTIAFMRDNDVDPIPSAAQVTITKAKILEIKPAHTADADVIVNAPRDIQTDFTFSALSPNTITMKAAIEDSLKEFFKENTTLGVDVVKDAYRSAIFNTIDPSTGDRVASFTLTKPAILINAQDENDYDNSPTTEGIFAVGSLHAATDVVTMSDGTLVTIDAVGGGGAVTQFTVNSAAARAAVDGETITQESTDGIGINFALQPGVDNITPATDLNVASGQIRTLGTVIFP